MKYDWTEKVISEYGEQLIKHEAKFGQESMERSFGNNIYDILIDPFQRSQQEKNSYVIEALQRYSKNELMNMSGAFEEKFLYWTESHFKSMLSSLNVIMRELFLKGNVPVKRWAGLRVRTDLAQHVYD